MKGQKTYSSAKAIHQHLRSSSGSLSQSEKTELYWQYFKLLKRAAYAGHTEALYDYAQQYENMSFLGINNPMYNPKKCVFWYTKACERNYPDAFNNLADLYERGEGCKQDLDKALQLYRRSAELGYFLGKKNHKLMLKHMAKGGLYNK